MRKFILFSPEFWWSPDILAIKKIGVTEKLLAVYLLTNQHSTMTGIYSLPIAYVMNDLNLDKESVQAALDALIAIGFCCYDDTREYVWVCEMGQTQMGSVLKPKDYRVKAVHQLLKQLPPLSFMPDFYERYANLFFLRNDNDDECP